MIIAVAGDNQFLMSRRLKNLVETFLKQESELALQRLDASETAFADIIDAVQSVPFLASKKMVVVRELSANKEAADKIDYLFSAVAPTTDLVIHEPSLDKRTVYYKALKSKTELEEYSQLDGRQLAKWLVDETKAAGGSLAPTDANYLIDRVGQNQAVLASELDKLLLHNPKIARQAIDLLTEKTPQSKIFDLLDATFAGRRAKALELYEEQRAQKVEPQAILALLTWQLQLLTLAKLGKGKTAAQLAKLGKVNPYPMGKAQTLAQKISDHKLEQMIKEALQIDYRSKTSAIDIDEALKTFIVTL